MAIKIKQAAPWIAIKGKPGWENALFFIVCEGTTRSESKTLLAACLDLIATYYVYDIAYPRLLAALLIFFEHFVFGLKDQQSVPVATSKLYTNLQQFAL